MQIGRSLANVGLVAAAAVLVIVTKRWESALTIVLPAVVIHWIISREGSLRRNGLFQREIRWQAVSVNFGIPLGLCLGVVLFWFPRRIVGFPVWGAYSIASFSMALLLIKLYERYLRMRKTEKAVENNRP
jgi:hypothetical protein